jgi:hypothetical protein
MSGLTITPMQRYADLKRSFRAMLPSRRKKLSAVQRALGARHDRSFIETMKSEVQAHLAAAGARVSKKGR